ncbi:MAG: hypothetical protein JNJ50_10455 [Acidobacteria bacterium]|nr:hypothetical protein [Acidobacteriota bacterium]
MDEKAMTHLTILTKNGIFSFLGLVRAQMVVDADGNNKPVTGVIKHDPREGQPFLKQFDTSNEAIRNYQEAISTSIERGWNVVYQGIPLHG